MVSRIKTKSFLEKERGTVKSYMHILYASEVQTFQINTVRLPYMRNEPG